MGNIIKSFGKVQEEPTTGNLIIHLPIDSMQEVDDAGTREVALPEPRLFCHQKVIASQMVV